MYRKRLLLLCVFFLLFGSLTGCQTNTYAYSQFGASHLAIDTLFLEFYEQLGGSDVLSSPISPKFTHNGREYQYTAAVLMVYDPLIQQYSLAPIGVEMGIAESPTAPGLPGGHEVYHGFQSFYDGLGGLQIVGAPLTSVRYSEERGGIEQFFENAGMFQIDGDPSNEIGLIHYGAWMCADACNFKLDPVFAPLLPNVVKSPFAQAVSRLNPAFTGKPLSEPYISTDGQVEQIFENVVVVSAPEKPAGIALRPITAMLGVPVQLNEQFDIPAIFEEFISRNSGLEFSGPAVTRYEKQSQEVFRQCFANLCLDYYPNQEPDLQIRLTPLGYVYKSRYYQKFNLTPTPTSSLSITMKVSKVYGLIAPSESQLIVVQLYQGYQPVVGTQPDISLMLPGGKVQSLRMPPTQSGGRTSLEIDPIPAYHGTRIDYRVCIEHQIRNEICVNDHFLIWGSP